MDQHRGTLTRSQRARACVMDYLHSERGRDTPSDIAWRLMHLDWASLGCRYLPSFDQIHQTRWAVEELVYLSAREEATADIDTLASAG